MYGSGGNKNIILLNDHIILLNDHELPIPHLFTVTHDADKQCDYCSLHYSADDNSYQVHDIILYTCVYMALFLWYTVEMYQ